MKSKRAEKVKKRNAKKSKPNQIIPKQVAMDNFDKSMNDRSVVEFKNMLNKCENMVTHMYKRMVHMEVAISKLIGHLTKMNVFCKSGASNMEAISMLNAEKNKLWLFKKEVMTDIVKQFIVLSKCTSQADIIDELNTFGDKYEAALTNISELAEASNALYNELELEEVAGTEIEEEPELVVSEDVKTISSELGISVNAETDAAVV